MVSLERTAWRERIVVHCPVARGFVEVGYDAAGPRQRSLAAHPCRALTACSMRRAQRRPHRALKLYELALETATWCRSWVGDLPPTEQ